MLGVCQPESGVLLNLGLPGGIEQPTAAQMSNRRKQAVNAPIFARVRLVIYQSELLRVAAESQRENLALRLQAHLAFASEYLRGQSKESNSSQETDHWIRFITGGGEPSIIWCF